MRRALPASVLALASFAAGFAARGCIGDDASRQSAPRPAPPAPRVGAGFRPTERRHASAPDGGPQRESDDASPDDSPVERDPRPPADEVVADAPKGVTIRGRCVDGSGSPIAAVAVLSAMPFGWSTRTGADGRFEVGAAAGADRFVRFTPDGPFAAQRITLPAPRDGEIDVGDVVLRAGGTIRGVFLAFDGRPVARALISLHDIDATCTTPRHATTDGEGRFVIEHVPDGGVCVSGRSHDSPLAAGEQDAQMWHVRAGDDIVLRPRSRHFVHFVYCDEAGRTVRIFGPRVRWFSLDDPSEGETFEWEGGGWQGCFVPVRPGAAYEIRFEIDGWLPLTHRFVGGEEGERRETLVFRPAGR